MSICPRPNRAARDTELEPVVASLTLVASTIDKRLVGHWRLEKFHYSDGFESTTERTLTLGADGAFHQTGLYSAWLPDSETLGPMQSSEARERGRWAVSHSRLIRYYDHGVSTGDTYSLRPQLDERMMMMLTPPDGGEAQTWERKD